MRMQAPPNRTPFVLSAVRTGKMPDSQLTRTPGSHGRVKPAARSFSPSKSSQRRCDYLRGIGEGLVMMMMMMMVMMMMMMVIMMMMMMFTYR